MANAKTARTPEEMEKQRREHFCAMSGQLLDDLTRDYPDNRTLFSSLFYDREDQSSRFRSLLERVYSKRDNFIIVGGAGIGKTSFILNLLSDDTFLKDNHLTPVLVDFRRSKPQTSDACMLSFIDDLRASFEMMHFPIHTLIDNVASNIETNVHRISKHIDCMHQEDNLPHLLLILDDFDYAESEWFDLLKYFLPLATCNHISIILTMRPPLLSGIEAADERITYYFSRNTSRFNLPPLEVREVLASRLAPILKPKSVKDSIINFIFGVFQSKSEVERLATRLGISNLHELRQFEYPMTEKHNNFMRLITNGNLREIFDIAYESLIYIYDNYDSLESRLEHDYLRKVIGYPGCMYLFSEKEDSRYKFVNIHKERSPQGNSLYYNTLEAVKLYRFLQEKPFYESLFALGHSRKTVDHAINFLCHKQNRFIVPVRLLPPEEATSLQLAPEYTITDKGDYYLTMTEWKEYRKKYGEPGQMLTDLTG